MRTQLFRGTGTALVTPFLPDRSVDFDALGRLIDHQIESGIEALAPCGSTGESATLSHDEKLAVIRFTVERAAGRVKVIAGTGSYDTAATVALTREARAIGVDGVLLVSPYYNKPTQEGLFEHYRHIAEAVDIPQVLYNVPGRTATNMLAETQVRIAQECPRVVATKEASGNLMQISEIIAAAAEGFSVLAGDDTMAVPVIALGGTGVIAVVSNYAPHYFGDMVRAALHDDIAAARALYYKLLPIMKLNIRESNPIPVKAAMHILGHIQDVYRLPLTPATPRTRELLTAELRNLDLLPA